jgi:hypothetical protein
MIASMLTSITVSAQSFKLPDYTRFKLANGLTVYKSDEQHDASIVFRHITCRRIYDYDRQVWRHLRLRHLNMEPKLTKEKLTKN